MPILLIFIFAFLLPGLILAFFFNSKEKIDFLYLLLQALVWGLASHLAIGVLYMAVKSQFDFQPGQLFAAVISVDFLTIFILTGAYKPKWWLEKIRKINFSFYELGTVAIIAALFVLIYSQVNKLPQPYFNPNTDQYFWSASAIYFANFPIETTKRIVVDTRYYKQSFAYVMAPYLVAIGKNLDKLQKFFLAWTYFSYALWIIALAQLGKKLLRSKYLGLLLPMVALIFYWNHYYLIAAAAVPQNLGIPLIITGLLAIIDFQRNKKEIIFLAAYVAVTYLIHIYSLAAFVIVSGLSVVIWLLFKSIGKLAGYVPLGQKYAFILKIFPLFIIANALFYFHEYYSQHLPPGFFLTYFKKITGIFAQPYLSSNWENIIWLASIGFLMTTISSLYFPKRKKVGDFFMVAAAISIIFLANNVWIFYMIVYVYPDIFRYHIILFPFLSLLAIIPIDWIINKISKRFYDLSIALVMLVIIISVPVLLSQIKNQQSLAFLDMITGRDKGRIAMYKKRGISDLLSINNKLSPVDKIIYFSYPDLDNTYAEWVFAPSLVLNPKNIDGCQKNNICLVNDFFIRMNNGRYEINKNLVKVVQNTGNKDPNEPVFILQK